VAQDEGPEFKPQYYKTKQNNNKKHGSSGTAPAWQTNP
jgi:hypothetical protein